MKGPIEIEVSESNEVIDANVDEDQSNIDTELTEAIMNGTNNYNLLINKPVINGKEAQGTIEVTYPISNEDMFDILS